MQGHCYSGACAPIAVQSSAGTALVPREAYFRSLAGVAFEDRWGTLGWLAFICCVYVGITALAARHISHLRK